MMRVFCIFGSEDRDLRCETYQDPKTFAEHLTDYLNGDHSLDTSLESSVDFASADEVDFSKEVTSSHHDIYDVASGLDKVFPDPVVTDSVAPVVTSDNLDISE